MKMCHQHGLRQCVSCVEHLRLRFGSQVLLSQCGQRKIINLSRKDCYLIENYLPRAGFVRLSSMNPRESSQDDDRDREKTK